MTLFITKTTKLSGVSENQMRKRPDFGALLQLFLNFFKLCLVLIETSTQFYTQNCTKDESCFSCRLPSEHQLESQGMELVNQNKLWAGIVFTNVPNDQKVSPLATGMNVGKKNVKHSEDPESNKLCFRMLFYTHTTSLH